MEQVVYSTNRPPLFDSNNFSWWKKRMRVFIESVDPQLWDIVEKGPLKITTLDDNGGTIDKPRADWNDNDYKKQKKNAQALNMLYCSLTNQDFTVVSHYETAKEVWDALNEIYEGTGHVKVRRMASLMNLYAGFRMEEDESIKDMFRRFFTIINQHKALGDDFLTTGCHVLKLLESLRPEYDTIALNIEVQESTVKHSLNELFSRLLVYEENGLVRKTQIREEYE